MAKLQRNIYYKYLIKEKIENFSYAEYSEAKKLLPKLLRINKRTFERYMYVRLDDSYDIPASHLAILACYFRCKMEDLLNYSPSKMIYTEMKRDTKEDLAASLGLTK